MKLVEVVWTDPVSIDEWESVEEIKNNFCDCPQIRTVGQLVYEDHEIIMVSLNIDEMNDKISCTMVIPKHAVKEYRTIYRQDPKNDQR